ncbi:DNA-binding transcriptional regulator, MarR family [Rhizobiales bacterium GAS191]|nr:DNA-binding transcriptional regulator, MarR family [Rhizobiales bacterium GAS191]
MSRGELMGALNRAMRDASGQGVLYSQAVAERLGINSTDLECLDVIVMRGPVAAGELARATGLTTGAITGVIDRLDRAGLARREHDPADRRKVMVRALPAIERRVAPLFKPMEQAALSALSPYDDKELALLLDFFVRAHEAAVAAMATLRAEPATSRTGKAGRAKSGAAKGDS